MGVITISRQSGSLGDEIAQAVAAQLGYKVYGKELINQAAARVGSPELALALIDELDLLGIKMGETITGECVETLRTIIEELAERGNVILIGRGSQVILKEHSGTFRVFIHAPLSIRIERMAVRQEISQRAARAQIEKKDRRRKRFLKHCFNVTREDPTLYDLMINTQNLTVEASAAILVCAARESEIK